MPLDAGSNPVTPVKWPPPAVCVAERSERRAPHATEGGCFEPGHARTAFKKTRPLEGSRFASLVRLAAVVCIVLLSGCVSELLGAEAQTTRNVACAVLSEARSPEAVVVVHGTGLEGAVAGLLSEWTNATGRTSFVVRWMPVPSLPLEELVRTLPGLEEDVALQVVVVPDLPDDATGVLARPGLVAISQAALDAGAPAGPLLLHFAGHAIGLVNAGVPLSTTSTAAREAPMHHEPSPQSVMHVGWHHIGTMPKTSAAYNRYSDALRDDMSAAATGVCA